MAFVGVVIGAGFASGQEVLQYFASFGTSGVVGSVIAGIIMLAAGTASLQLGSYFLATDHSAVFRRIAHPVVAKFLDASVLLTLFATGFVMFAGSGANMNQQFGWPVWMGSLMMLVLVLLAGLLNVDKVTAVIGAVTPLIVAFVVIGVVYAIVTSDADTTTLNEAAAAVGPSIPNWFIASLNYVGLALMVGVSMSIIIGGNSFNPKAAGIGGFLGSVIYAVMLVLAAFGLFKKIDVVGKDDVPMLSIINEIHPVLGTVMSLVIVGMIFNTAISMFYAFGKRVTTKKPSWFYPAFAASAVIGWGCSFLGFRTLVGVVYPILGYIGIVLTVVVAGAWIKGFRKIRQERVRREKIHELVRRKLDPRMRFSSKQSRMLERYAQASVVSEEQIADSVRAEVRDELDEIEGAEASDAVLGSDDTSAGTADSAQASAEGSDAPLAADAAAASARADEVPLGELRLPDHAGEPELEDLSTVDFSKADSSNTD